MEAKDVTSLPWKMVTNLTGLSTCTRDTDRHYYVGEADVDAFVENLYRGIARELNITYGELKPILEDENRAFYELKRMLFHDSKGLFSQRDDQLIHLLRLLRVPDTKNVVNENKVSICFKLFEELSDIEKMAFFQKIGKINVRIEYSTVQTEETTIE